MSAIWVIIMLYMTSTTVSKVIFSPNNEIEVLFEISNVVEPVHFEILNKKQRFIHKSYIQLDKINSKGNIVNSFLDLTSSSVVQQDSHNSTWNVVWGATKLIHDEYSSVTVSLEYEQLKTLNLEVRVYNYGVAYRLSMEKSSLSIRFRETLHLRFPGEPIAWFTRRWENYEGPFNLNNFNPDDFHEQSPKGCETPVTVKVSNHALLSVHEAKLFSGNPFTIDSKRSTQWDTVLNVTQYNGLSFISDHRKKSSESYETSWRTITLGSTAGQLIEHSDPLILSLNEPSTYEEESDTYYDWIKPGVSMWDWRVRGATTETGFTYELNQDSLIRLVDFASANNVSYLLIDGGWYGDEKKDSPFNSISAVDIPALSSYALNLNVGLILYVHDEALAGRNLNNLFQQYESWGIKGIKHGFLYGGDTDAKVSNTKNVIELCLKYHLTYQLHEPNKPTGWRRTYPNYLNSEFTNSMLDGPFRPAATPTDLCTLPFVNNLAGPVDRSPGLFALDDAIDREKCTRQIPSTVVSQIAQGLVYFTGVWNLVDTGEEYLKKSDLFEFVRRIPLDWEYTKVINGEIGEYVTILRKAHNQDYFIGSLANENGKVLTINLEFLSAFMVYEVVLFEDDTNASFLFDGPENIADGAYASPSNRELYTVRTLNVTNENTIDIVMQPGGGFAAWFREVQVIVPKTVAPTVYPTENAAPTVQPTESVAPTVQPTESVAPTVQPTESIAPTAQPTESTVPTIQPTESIAPTAQPTESTVPTIQPTESIAPTVQPTESIAPTAQPTESTVPTIQPTESIAPTVQPTESTTPTTKPSETQSPTTGAGKPNIAAPTSSIQETAGASKIALSMSLFLMILAPLHY